MEILTKTYVKVREFQKRLSKGQTMTEYALILAAVAVVVFVTYEVMGRDGLTPGSSSSKIPPLALL